MYICLQACACACAHACGICAPACLLVVKMFHHTETFSLFYSSKTRPQKMLKTTEQKGLKISTDIDHSLTFSSKVSRPNIVHLFTKETIKSVLKRKKEPENIVGTEKSKKRLYKKTLKLEHNQTAKHFKLYLFMDKELRISQVISL